MINDLSSTALTGIRRGMSGMNKAANEIASAAVNTSIKDDGQVSSKDLTESLVDLKVSEKQTQASIKVLKISDETLGTLLDVIS